MNFLDFMSYKSAVDNNQICDYVADELIRLFYSQGYSVAEIIANFAYDDDSIVAKDPDRRIYYDTAVQYLQEYMVQERIIELSRELKQTKRELIEFMTANDEPGEALFGFEARISSLEELLQEQFEKQKKYK